MSSLSSKRKESWSKAKQFSMQSSAASAVLKRVTIIRIACGSQPRPITVQIKQTRQGACNLQVCDSPGARVRSQKRMLGLVDRTVEPLSPVLTQDGHLQKTS